jgi:hypothetical protein
MTSKQIVILIVIAIVFAGGGFYGGMRYQQSKSPTRRNVQFTGGRAGMGFVNGQVMSADSGSITVKNQNGGSQIVILAPSTQYRKTVDGTASDVVVGGMVTVTGTSNSDGSLTAQNVQIRSASSTPLGSPPSK